MSTEPGTVTVQERERMLAKAVWCATQYPLENERSSDVAHHVLGLIKLVANALIDARLRTSTRATGPHVGGVNTNDLGFSSVPPASDAASRFHIHTDKEVEAVGWAILQALHENVPEALRPMSWSDLNQAHEQRTRAAAVAAIECIRDRDADVARGMMKALEKVRATRIPGPMAGCGCPNCKLAIEVDAALQAARAAGIEEPDEAAQ